MNLRNTLVPNFLIGFVLGSVCRLTHSLVALSVCHSLIVHILASASAMAVATILKVPVIAWAPILCTLFIDLNALCPQACVQTLEA